MNHMLDSAVAVALSVIMTGELFGIDGPEKLGEASLGATTEFAQTGSRFAGVPPPGSKRPDGGRYDGPTNRNGFSGVAPPDREVRDENEAKASGRRAAKTATCETESLAPECETTANAVTEDREGSAEATLETSGNEAEPQLAGGTTPKKTGDGKNKPKTGKAKKRTGADRIVRKEMTKALNQRKAGAKAESGLKTAQSKAQTGLKTILKNMDEVRKAADNLAPTGGPRYVSDDHVNLGPSDDLVE